MRNNDAYKCSNCQKDFSESEIYQVGKEKELLCQECDHKSIKSCSWCGKNSNEGWLSSGQNYNEIRWKHWFCDQKCSNKFRENAPEKLAERQKRQELLDKGYRPCQGRGIMPFLAGLEKCETLIPPTAEYCEKCKEEQQKEQEINKEWKNKNPEKAQVEEKKYQQAQDWWNSLSKEEKQSELKKIEAEWIKKMGSSDFHGFVEGHGSLVEFKNGRLHCSPEDLSLVPVVFLERFGIQVYPRFSDFGRDFPGYNKSLETKIKEKEKELTNAKREGKSSDISKLEQELKDLKLQQKNNSSSSQEQNAFSWSWILGIGMISSIILGFWVIRKRQKGKK